MALRSTLSRTHMQALPWPLAALWLTAVQSRRPEDAYAAAEGVVRVLVAVVAADCLDVPWDDAAQRLLGSRAEARSLARPSFGTRVAWLRALVGVHARGAERILPSLDAWWAGMDGADGALTRLVEQRNAVAHAGARTNDSASDALVHEALHLLGGVLRAGWLRDVQLLCLDSAEVRLRRPGFLTGRVRRLVGAAPHAAVALEPEWPAAFPLAEGRVYLASARGDRWRWCPTLTLDDAPRPARVLVFDGVRKGDATWWDPASLAAASGFTPPWPARAPDWGAFLELCARDAQRVGIGLHVLTTPDPALIHAPPAALDVDLSEGRLLEGVRLVRRLGEGGAAEVWEGADTDDGRVWAYKVLKPALAASPHEVQRFDREIATMRRLRGEGCHRVLGPVERLRWGDGDERRVVMRMPRMAGTLRDAERRLRAQTGQGPDPKTLHRWLLMAAEGLAQLHAHDVVHRDVKPSNLLLDDAGEIFLADLGIAKDATRSESWTRTNDTLGTERYMAPEQLRGARDVGAPADVYALAVSIDEVWRGETSVHPGEGMPEPLGAIVRDMAAFHPRERPSAAEVVARMGGTASSVRSVAPIVGPRGHAAWGRRLAVLVLVAATVASAFVPVALAPRVEHLVDRSGTPVAEILEADGARRVVPLIPDPVLARALATLPPLPKMRVPAWRYARALLSRDDAATRRLTLDAGLQAAATRSLDGIRERSAPRAAAIVVLDASNGDILAWAGRAFGADADGVDPMGAIPLGSLLQVPLVAMVLDQAAGQVTLDTEVDLEGGKWTFLAFLGDDRSLHDDHPGGMMRVRDVLARGSVIGAAKLAMRLNLLGIEEDLRRFGLPGEHAGPGGTGILVTPSSATELPGWAATGGMGDRVLTAPPVALASMMSTFALDGRRYVPGLEAGGRSYAEPTRADPSNMRAALHQVVNGGTGTRGCVPGFDVGGKTSTARTSADSTRSAFLGYARGGGSAVTIAVVVEDPTEGSHYGGIVAAPAFAELVPSAMKALGVSPSPEFAHACAPAETSG